MNPSSPHNPRSPSSPHTEEAIQKGFSETGLEDEFSELRQKMERVSLEVLNEALDSLKHQLLRLHQAANRLSDIAEPPDDHRSLNRPSDRPVLAVAETGTLIRLPPADRSS